MKPLNKITYIETGDKFTLAQTADGFDATPVRFTKNSQPEHWTFQELLEKFRAGEIAFEGFTPEENNLVQSYLQNLIHQKGIADCELKITDLETKLADGETKISDLTAQNNQLNVDNTKLQEEIAALRQEIASQKEIIINLKPETVN
jgi:chromosome segregation ATPase